ncbi:diaminopimelate decarboxylase family protein [Acidaminobacterium chupaoyuni]
MNKNEERLIEENQSAFYVFDISRLKQRIQYLRNSLPKKTALCYAVKANPFIAGEIKDDLDRFEICSPGEAGICKTLGIESEKMVISGIYKTPDVMEAMVADPRFDGVFTVESVCQYRLFCRLSEKYRRELRLLLRLTNDSQFGVNEADIEEIIAGRSGHPFLHVLGIQFFSGTQKTSLKKLRREIDYLEAFLLRLKEELDYVPEELEYGPGFPVSYFVSDELEEEELLGSFSELLNNMTARPRITLELGRSIAASCGKYYTHIVDIKQNKGQNYALVDGGMHHIVYFGQHMAMKHPFLSVVGKTEINSGSTWAICGSLCSMHDIIAKQIPLPDIEIGDTLCFENTGAYCMTEGISLFLSRDLPAIYLMREDGSIICARRAFETEQLNTPNYERMF